MLWLDAHNRLGKVVAAEVGVAQSCPTLATPWTGARQAPLSMGFSRQEDWSGLLRPPHREGRQVKKKNTVHCCVCNIQVVN